MLLKLAKHIRRLRVSRLPCPLFAHRRFCSLSFELRRNIRFVSGYIRVALLLARTEEEYDQKKQAALGTHVYRRADGSDAMWEECLGPSAYSKAQGQPVRVWGMLACGHLSIYILDESEVMNQELYSELIDEYFEDWMGNSTGLVCDFERCLRTASSLEALDRIGLPLVEEYPRVSQDFNAIENAWDMVKQRLDQTLPVKREDRGQFVERLMSAVAWVNRQRAEDLWYISTNQKERADECLESNPPGGRTTW